MGDKRIIGVVIDGKPTWHVVSTGAGDYATLCGLDGHDDHIIRQSGAVEPKRGQKIDCPQCKTIWQEVIGLKLRRGNFS